MPDQFIVPQFIDVEDKILGSITVRQFLILMGAGMIEFILYRFFTLITLIVIGVPILVMAAVLAFVKINGQPFHFFLLNLIQTLRRPSLRVWDKKITTGEAKAKMTMKQVAPPPPPPSKAPVTATRLQELSLVVNTGGVYRPEEES